MVVEVMEGATAAVAMEEEVMAAVIVVALLVVHTGAFLHVRKSEGGEKACVAEDLQHRMQLQNKLAGMCEEMCKEVGSYPSCPGCPNFVPPDPTPGVMTWDELLTHMDNLSEWGRGMIKGWLKGANLYDENTGKKKA